jgi:succinoglycan biosynthesis protein ExoA
MRMPEVATPEMMVSVILPVLNEAPVLQSAVASLLAQELDPGWSLEVLVIDGGSSDGGIDIVRLMAHQDQRIRLLHNQHRRTPFAFNIGLRAAQGDFVCILGAHCVYAPNYIAICLREMLDRGAVGCSGRVRTGPRNSSVQARLAHWTMAHPFGVSWSSFRTHPEGYTDSPPYPVFRKQPLLDLGAYDESMLRNQDNEMNYRLRRAGYRLFLTWKTSCEYLGKATLRAVAEYARSNGFWCGISFRREPRSLGLHLYAPFLFVACTACGLLLLPVLVSVHAPSWLVLAAASPLPVHLVIGQLAGIHQAVVERSLLPLLLPWTFLGFHWVYGVAFLRGALSEGGLVGRPSGVMQ